MDMNQREPFRAGLLGEHLSHSFSPRIHEALSRGRYTYELFELAPDEVEGFIKGDKWDALNVTIPYKQAVIPLLDAISDEALRIGAVNTVTRLPDGRLMGDNTDYFGFLHTLKACACDPSGKKALVLGNGGAAATAVTVLSDIGAKVTVLARNQKPVGGIIPEPFENACIRHGDAAIVVNCTPVGMYPRTVGESPISLRRLQNVRAVFDMIYNPARTALLQEAHALGIPGYNGLLMLVAQAKRASELFSHTELNEGLIDSIARSIALDTGNIVLVGMPGSGKSTVGRALADTLGRPFVDTDALITDAVGRSIPDIFSTEGEEAFRALETEAVKKAGMMSGAVIATGGGVVTKIGNYAPLSQNGRIVFIKRDLDRLPVKGRPVSRSRPIEDLYNERLPLYKQFAEREIDNNGSPDETVEAILRSLGYRDETEV